MPVKVAKELLTSEVELTGSARESYFATAIHCCAYLTTQAANIDDNHFLFQAMHGLVGKHTALATPPDICTTRPTRRAG